MSAHNSCGYYVQKNVCEHFVLRRFVVNNIGTGKGAIAKFLIVEMLCMTGKLLHYFV